MACRTNRYSREGEREHGFELQTTTDDIWDGTMNLKDSRRRKRLRSGDQQFHKKVEKYLRLKRMGWKKDHAADQVAKELQGRVTRQKRAADKEAIRAKAKAMLTDGPCTKQHISAEEYALLSRDLRSRMLREMPERIEVVA